jgi:hypothetical protein
LYWTKNFIGVPITNIFASVQSLAFSTDQNFIMFIKFDTEEEPTFNEFTTYLRFDNLQAFFLDGLCKDSVFSARHGFIECYASTDTGSLFYANTKIGEYSKHTFLMSHTKSITDAVFLV